jgi:hypothetical protein
MSLFINALAFTDPQRIDVAKLGIIGGSLGAGVLGAITCALVMRRRPESLRELHTAQRGGLLDEGLGRRGQGIPCGLDAADRIGQAGDLGDGEGEIEQR